MAEERVVLRLELDESGAARAVSAPSAGSPAAGTAAERSKEQTGSVADQLSAAGLTKKQRAEARALGLPVSEPADSPAAQVAESTRAADTLRRFGSIGATSGAEETLRRFSGGGAPGGARRAGARGPFADPSRRRRGRPGRGVFGAAIASGAAGQAANLTRFLGPAAAAGAASGAAIFAASNPAAAAAALGVVTAASVALAPAFAVLTAGVIAATSAFRELEELGMVNAEIARAQALRSRREVLGRIRRGERIGFEGADFITERSRFNEAIKDAGAEILSQVLPVITSTLQQVTTLIELITPIIVPLAQAFGTGISGIFLALRIAFPQLDSIFTKIETFFEINAETARGISDAKERAESDAFASAMNFFDPVAAMESLSAEVVGN